MIYLMIYLFSGLTYREIRVRGQESTSASLNLTQANDTRHALSKFIYSRMFDWLVDRINSAMDMGAGGTNPALMYRDSELES